MKTNEILALATEKLIGLRGKTIDVLNISRPDSMEYALHLSKVVSKISPLIGNMIEFISVNLLNEIDWQNQGKWIRQDPGFPDTIFIGEVNPNPGVEIKTWFPLATEITARFKDSLLHFEHDQTHVAVIAWLPEFLIFGKPKVIDVWVGSGRELAIARDRHYNKPPDYLVFEPEDTSSRTRNLQQTNTNGYKFQGTQKQLEQAKQIVQTWGDNPKLYEATAEYQAKLKSLLQRFPYRLDTNFAKMDRIEHEDLERFKDKVLNTYIFESITPATKHINSSYAAYATAGCWKYFFTWCRRFTSVRIKDSAFRFRSCAV